MLNTVKSRFSSGKTKIVTIKIILLTLMFFAVNIFSQQLLPHDPPKYSSEENRLMLEYNDAKSRGDMAGLQNIQNKLDAIKGSDTRPCTPYGGNFVLINQPAGTGDVNNVALSQLNGIRALATATEQRGLNNGRIWVAAAISNSTARDTIYYFHSDDNGTSWILLGFSYLANSDEVNYDQMDMEIIEDNAGDKYVWLVYGLTASNGKQFTAATVIKTPVFAVNQFALMWQGENLSNTTFGHFRPHITSDNARYSNAATVYIAVSVDTSFGQQHVGYPVFVKIINPYTTTPAITYVPRWGGLFLSSLNPTDYHLDIAFIHNGADSLMLTLANSYSSPELTGVYTLNINFDNTINNSTVFVSNGFNKQFGRIACSGGTNQKTVLFIYRENFQNSGDWDIKAQKTTNAGLTWSESPIDNRRDNVVIPYPADIIAVRNRDGRFALSYTIAGPSNFDTVKYVFTDGVLPGYFFRRVNHLSGFERPKAGFRLVDGDSCFTVWSQKNGGSGNNIWASGGCSTQITIGIENNGNEIPAQFKLEQNYPNPFNPVTDIKFSIPKTGFVKLIVYDILGREIKTLVSENLAAGNYKYDFDASGIASGVYFYRLESENFTDVKKMLLIK